MNGQPRFDRVRNSKRRIVFSHLFSLVFASNTVDISIFFFDFFAFALLFRYFKSSIDIIPFLSQESDNRFFIRFLPLTDKSYDSRSIEGEERKRAEYRCSNWTRERSISSVVKFFATRGKIGNKIRDECFFHLPLENCIIYRAISFLLLFNLSQPCKIPSLHIIYENIYILIYYIVPLLRVPLQKFREK